MTGDNITTKHALLIVGSAKPQGTSTSEALGKYLLERLEEHSFETTILFASHIAHEGRGVSHLHEAMDKADLLILASPLYVDSLPYLLTLTLERLAAQRQAQSNPKPCALFALVNSGFSEAQQNEIALAICRQFAQQAGFTWLGGLALGGGQAIHGQPLRSAQGIARNVIKALDVATDNLAQGKAVPDQAVALMPASVYTFMGGLGWRWQAWQNRGSRQLGARPFEKENSQ
ncbi:MAG: NAD(P)H-dependent oxidoreductase [Candidatus Zophobacter franzmannii]|nr:NAD(P)H-dependent oxidoreductase [Candidatus Zophobacter franzmannii]